MSARRTAALIAGVSLAVWLTSVAPEPARAQSEPAGRKLAFLVGVKEYRHLELKNLDFPERDVDELAAVLKGQGFQVVLLTTAGGKEDAALSPSAENIRERLKTLLRGAGKQDLIVVGLAGHGLQPLGSDESYFCPMDANPVIENGRLAEPETLVGIGDLLAKLRNSGIGDKLLLVDACRNDPSVRGRRGMDHVNTAAVPPQTGVLLSCSPGEFSFENKSLGGGHGVFFYHVIEGLKGKARGVENADVTWDGLRSYVKSKVPATVKSLFGKAGGEQRPNEFGNLSGEPTVLATARITGHGAAARLIDSCQYEAAVLAYDEAIATNPTAANLYAERALARLLHYQTLYWSGELGDDTFVKGKLRRCDALRAELQNRIKSDAEVALQHDPLQPLALAILDKEPDVPAWLNRGDAVDGYVAAVVAFNAKTPERVKKVREQESTKNLLEHLAVDFLNKEFGPEAVSRFKANSSEVSWDKLQKAIGRKMTRAEEWKLFEAVFAPLVLETFKDPLQLLERARKATPNSQLIWLLKAYLFCNTVALIGDPTTAVAAATESIQLQPENNMLAYLARADCFIELEKPREAVDDLTRAIAIRPNGYFLYEKRARAYDDLKENSKAKIDREIASRLSTRYSQ
jgi:tetratricopeptide (TPR) repeat protein